MTIDKNTTEQNSSLPEARSPKALDDRILSYARSNAAEKPRTNMPVWMSGLAAASIAGIAVLIALPEQYTPEQASSPRFDHYMELPKDNYASRSKETATAPSLQRLEQAYDAADMGRKNRASADNGVQADSPAARVAKAEKHAGAASTDPASAERHREASRELRASKSPSAHEMPARAPSYAEIDPAIRTEKRPQRSMALEELMVTASKREDTLEQSMEEVTLIDSGNETARADVASAMASTEPVLAFAEKEILTQQDDKLEACIVLWRKQKQVDAKTCYAALLEDCQDCSLPDTVKEAAEAFPHIGPNDPNTPQ